MGSGYKVLGIRYLLFGIGYQALIEFNLTTCCKQLEVSGISQADQRIILIHKKETERSDSIIRRSSLKVCTVVKNEIFQPRSLDGVQLLKLQTNLPYFNRIAKNFVRYHNIGYGFKRYIP